MLFAVSTVMDTPEHVRRYVQGNLAGGIDHLVVFLDKPKGPRQDESAAFLDEHPSVTCVRAGVDWWHGERPKELNERQCTNANVVKRVLADLGRDDDWVFHVDGDEIARIDRAVLDAVPTDAPVVRLAVREAVSRREWPGEPTLFKRELSEDDLTLLHGLGLVREATNQAYFRGHLMGKSGVRAGAAGWLTLHKVAGDDGAALAPYEHEGLELFHYESYSVDEFVRKWTSMVASGPRANFRADRRSMARTMRALINRGLEPEALRRQLVRYYELNIEEEVDALRDLDVLLEADPLAAPADRAPASAPADAIAAGIEAWRAADKSGLFHGASPGALQRRGSEGSSGRSWSRLGRRSDLRSSSSASSDRSSERR